MAGNDVEITVRVDNQTPRGFTGINTSLRTLREKAEEATTALTGLHAAAGTVKVKAKFDDRITAGVAAIKTAVDDLRNTAAVKIKAKIEDKTASGIATIKTALDGLRAESPVKLKVKFSGQVTDIQAAAQAMQDLKGDTQGVNRVLTTLGTKVTAISTLKDKAEEATTALAGLRTAASDIEVSAALDDQTEAAFTAITARLDDLRTASAQILVTVDDQATADLDGIKAALDGLKAHSPVRLEASFDGQTAEVTAAAQAMAALKSDVQAAGTALRSVATRATAAAAGLNQVHDAAQDAARALAEAALAGTAAAAALNDVRGAASRAATALRRVGDQADTAGGRILQLGDHTDRLSQQMDDLRDSTQDAGDGLRGLRGSLPGLAGALRGASDAAGGGSGTGGGRGSGLVGALGGIAAATAAAAAAFGSAAPAAAGLGAVLASMAPAAGTLATGMLMAASAGAALKIGTQGVGDALKNAFDPDSAEAYAEALKKLAPNARSFVETIRGMGPAFKELRLDVQDKLFSGFGKALTQTAKVAGPAVKRSLLDSAGALNLMGKGVLDTAREMGKSGSLGTALDSANKGLKNISNLPGTLVQGLVQVGAAAGPAFERMTKAAGGGLDRLSDRMTQAFKSGSMEKAISTAAGLVKQLGQGLANVGKVFGNVFGAAAQDGGSIIGVFRDVTAELAKATGAKGAQDAFKSLFAAMGQIGRTGAGLLGEAIRGIGPVITALGPPVQNLVKNLGAGLTPVIRALSPILTQAATSLGRVTDAVSPLLPVVGGLISGALDALAPVLREAGDGAALLAESASSLLGPALEHLPGLLRPAMELFGGLASLWIGMQNNVLKELQPSFRRVGEALGKVAAAVEPLMPLFTDLAEFGMRGVAKVAELAAKAFGELAEVAAGRLARGLEKVAAWVTAHQDELRAAFGGAKRVLLEFALAAVEAAPMVFGAFRGMVSASLDALGLLVDGLAAVLGPIPGIGDAVKKAAENFDSFRDFAKRGLDKTGEVINDFARKAGPKLRQELKLNTGEVFRKIPPAQRAISGVKGVARQITVSSNAARVAGAARGAIRAVPDRSAKISVSASGLGTAYAARNAILSIPTSRTTYIRVHRVGEAVRAISSANGNLFRSVSFANGSESHVAQISRPTMRVWAEPETGGEAYIPLSPAKRARSLAILEEVAERFGYGLEKFARGGMSKAARAKVAREAAKREREARNSLVGDLTISRFGQVAGAKRTEFRSALARPSDIGGLVNTLNQWRSNIQKATHGGVERSLLRSLDTAGRSLLKYARTHDKVSADLDKARSKLSDLRAAASQLRDSVASGIKSAANVTGVAGGGGRVTLGGVMAGLTSARDQSGAFAGALAALRKRGLRKDILADIAGAGLDGGLQTAQALMGASKSDIALMNQLQGQITSNAKKAGTTTADAMYAAGIKAAEGVVKGLENSKSKLEKAMDGVASALEKAIKKALGVKGRAHGGVTGAAGGGPRSGLTLVGEQGWELLDLPAGSRVRTHGDSRRMLAAGGGGGSQRPIELVVNLDGRTLARQIFDPFRGEIRDRGGLAALGRP